MIHSPTAIFYFLLMFVVGVTSLSARESWRSWAIVPRIMLVLLLIVGLSGLVDPPH